MKEIKRYTLGILIRKEQRKITGSSDLEKLLEELTKYNSNLRNPYFIGDIKVVEEKGLVTFKKYKKLTDMRTLNNLDIFTTHYENEEELFRDLNIGINNFNEVVIMYRSSKTIRFIRVLYSRDKKYLDKDYVKTQFIMHSKEEAFIDFLLNKKYFVKSAQNLEEIENLYQLKRAFVYSLYSNMPLSYMSSFYKAFIFRNDKFNYFNFRMLGTLLREYELNNEDTLEQQYNELPEETKKEDETMKTYERIGEEMSTLSTKIKEDGYTYKAGLQTVLSSYKLQLLKDIYREIKEGALDLSTDIEDELQKRLKLTHETTK